MSKKLSLIIILSLLFSLILLPAVTAVHQLVKGYVKYSDGSNIPNGVVVTITDENNGNSMTVKTQQANEGPGCYLVQVEDLDASEGHVINVSVFYGGCKGNNSVIVNTSQGPSLWCNVTIYGNLPPKAPNQPSGNTSGYHDINYNYSTSTWDTDDDEIYYWFDWDDNTNSGWMGPYSSNETCTSSHTWEEPGNYQIKAKAKDEHDAELGAGWSDTLEVNITNQAPTRPNVPSGLTFGYTNNSYTYSTNATDPNSDDLYYWFDWGEGNNSGWIGPYNSGATASSSHQWNSPGNYSIKAKVKDEYDLESQAGWANPLNITINQSLPINLEPVADFTYTPETPLVNQTVNFTDVSEDYDGDIVNWSWEFGDGTNSTLQNPSHVYNQPGEYLVNLTVTDDENASDIDQQKITVTQITPEKNVTWEKTEETILSYSPENQGTNYLVWKGEAINASSLVENASLSKGDSISVFSKNQGTWITYTVGVSNVSDDFLVSSWDVVIIQCTSKKTILVDISNQNETTQSVNISYTFKTETKKSNSGYNFFAWTSNTAITVKEFVDTYGFSNDDIAISLYDPDSYAWLTYNPSLPAIFQKHFTIQPYSIVCIKVTKDYQQHIITIT